MNLNQYLEFLACPNCNYNLHSISQCESCGLKFEMDGDTPKLFPTSRRRTVQFEFNSDRSVVDENILQTYINDPPIAEVTSNTPYHLDPAHIYVINQLPPNQNILEIGCGGGQSRQWFEGKGHRYIGVDVSKVRVGESLQQFGGSDILCDAHFLPFQDRQFDVVYSAAVTEHLACPFLVAQEVARVLKPGGYYLGNVSFLEPWHDNSFFHMSVLGVIELLTQAGLEIKYVWPERGYSGYRSLFTMGNKLTKNIVLVGEAAYFIYRLGNRVKASARRIFKTASVRDIYQVAKVSGAVFWIAVRSDTGV